MILFLSLPLFVTITVAEPSVSSTRSPYTDNSSEVSQSSAEPQQPIVSEFPDGGPVLSELPFGGPIEFNWPLSNAWFGFGVGEYFPPLTSGSPFLVVVIPPRSSDRFKHGLL